MGKKYEKSTWQGQTKGQEWSKMNKMFVEVFTALDIWKDGDEKGGTNVKTYNNIGL